MKTPGQKLHLDILPPPQRALWPRLAEITGSLREYSFVLYGGTALALQLGHRQSVDFDFFSNKQFEPDELHGSHKLLTDSQVAHVDTDVLIVQVEPDPSLKPVRVSFHGYRRMMRAKEPLLADNGVSIASVEDIFGSKCHVVCLRPEIRDYLDICDILTLTDLTLQDGLEAAMTIYGRAFNPLRSLDAMVYFDDLDKDNDLYDILMQRRPEIENFVAGCDVSSLRQNRSLGQIMPVLSVPVENTPDFER